jgi:predicted small secreted protein
MAKLRYILSVELAAATVAVVLTYVLYIALNSKPLSAIM